MNEGELHMPNWFDDPIKKRFIYALYDPRADFYSLHIGHTDHPKRRLRTHITQPTNSNVRQLVFALNQVGLEPKMMILEAGELSSHEAFQLELVWITVAVREGFQLLNGSGEMRSAANLNKALKIEAQKRSLPKDRFNHLIQSGVIQLPLDLIQDELLDNLDLSLTRY